MESLKLFIQESRQEFKRVNWPSRNETARLTVIVIGMALGIAAFLGATDFALIYVLNKFILGI
jgi:preprotein translocase SecE subunit